MCRGKSIMFVGAITAGKHRRTGLIREIDVGRWTMAVGGIRTERMDPVDVAWLHMDGPTNPVGVVNTVLWFDAPVDQTSVLQVFEDRVVSRFRRFRQRVADPPFTLAPWAAPEWVDDAGFALAAITSAGRGCRRRVTRGHCSGPPATCGAAATERPAAVGVAPA